MKTTEKVPSKVKNSFIYFQIGLIATMVVVLFILELNFETKPLKKIVYVPTGIEETFIPTDFKINYEPKNEVVQKTVLKPVTPRAVDKLEVKPNEVEIITKTEINTENTTSSTNTEANHTETKTENTNTGTSTDSGLRSVYSIEQYPMFAACQGVAKSEQKKCFDEQLFKAVLKNLEYPSNDLENGKQGVVFLEFIISSSGQIVDVSAVTNARSTEEMKKNAIKALKKVPKIIPAKQGDNSVAIKYALPVSFKISK
jgi:TonB family protein